MIALPICSTPGTAGGGFGRAPAWKALGKVGYSAYIWHLPVLELLNWGRPTKFDSIEDAASACESECGVCRGDPAQASRSCRRSPGSGCHRKRASQCAGAQIAPAKAAGAASSARGDMVGYSVSVGPWGQADQGDQAIHVAALSQGRLDRQCFPARQAVPKEPQKVAAVSQKAGKQAALMRERATPIKVKFASRLT